MAKRRRTNRARRKGAPREAKQFGDAGAEIVKAAARLLDQEMAIGITTAKAVQQRLQKERRIDPSDFKEALTRFQADARDVVNALDRQLDGRQLQQNAKLAKQFVSKTNDLLDIIVAVVNMGAELADQLIQANLAKQDAGRSRKPRR